MLKDYVKIKTDELKDLLFITAVFALLFSITFIRFTSQKVTYITAYILFFAFILILLGGKLLFMKFFAYKNCFEINLRMTYFDRYWFKPYDRLSYTAQATKHVSKKSNKKNEYTPHMASIDFKGIPMPIVSLFLYILTLGLFIFPSVWNYTIKKIPHRFLGTKQKYEMQEFIHVSNYRYSKILFLGYLYYFIFGIILKVLSSALDFSFYNWFIFSLYWIAFFTLIPILGTEGYELFARGKLGWAAALTILVLGMSALLVFQSITYIIAITVISAIITFIVLLWKQII